MRCLLCEALNLGPWPVLRLTLPVSNMANLDAAIRNGVLAIAS